MTKLQYSNSPVNGQVFRTSLPVLTAAAVCLAVFCFSPSANAQGQRDSRKADALDAAIVEQPQPTYVRKPVASRKASAVENKIAVEQAADVQKDVIVAVEAPAQQLVALQPATAVQTEVAATPVAAVATEVAAQVAEPQPVVVDPAVSDPAATDPADSDPAVKEGDGGGTNCQVCHKNRQTIELPCNSVALRRHRAHGDYDGACPTRGSREE